MLTDILMPWLPGLRLESIATTENQIIVTLQSTQVEPKCPVCAQASPARHSWYRRKLADLPWAGVSVQLQLKVRRLFCRNAACQRTIFTERLPLLASPYARRTQRLVQEQRQLALGQGGEAAARIGRRQGMPGAAKTLLRCVRKAPLPNFQTPRVLGVDDWAMRKGHTYGTILVDLERHQPVDLLADRTSATLAQWLREHPGVEIISRDRASDYAEGAARGAPDAIQVADRFHLLQNIREVLERLLERQHARLSLAAQQTNRNLTNAATEPIPIVESAAATPESQFMGSPPAKPPPVISLNEQRRQEHRAKRYARYTEVRQLHAEGLGIRAIARQLKMNREVVRRFLGDQFPERAPRPPVQSMLAPYFPYLTAQLTAGRANALQLWRELKAEYGYTGSHGLVSIWVAANRSLCPPKAQGKQPNKGRPPKAVPPKPTFPTPSARRAAWLLLAKPDDLEETQASFVNYLCDACADVRVGQSLAQDFASMVRKQDAPALDTWIGRAKASQLPEFVNFVRVLCRDRAAVAAALSMNVSNGQVEGQVNRLKLIKRTMYGRANFDLLKRRVLAA